MKPAYARLHVLLARESPRALIIRHGTAKSVCTILWDRETDTFTLGQWMRGRIQAGACDLSPSGEHFIYSAQRYVVTEGELHQWTVVSRAPYLKAIAYYSWRWGGGWFLNDHEYAIFGGDAQEGDRESPEVRRLPQYPPKPTLYLARMQRDGWRIDDRRSEFSSKLELVREAGAGWELHMSWKHEWLRREVHADAIQPGWRAGQIAARRNPPRHGDHKQEREILHLEPAARQGPGLRISGAFGGLSFRSAASNSAGGEGGRISFTFGGLAAAFDSRCPPPQLASRSSRAPASD